MPSRNINVALLLFSSLLLNTRLIYRVAQYQRMSDPASNAQVSYCTKQGNSLDLETLRSFWATLYMGMTQHDWVEICNKTFPNN